MKQTHKKLARKHNTTAFSIFSIINKNKDQIGEINWYREHIMLDSEQFGKVDRIVEVVKNNRG